MSASVTQSSWDTPQHSIHMCSLNYESSNVHWHLDSLKCGTEGRCLSERLDPAYYLSFFWLHMLPSVLHFPSPTLSTYTHTHTSAHSIYTPSTHLAHSQPSSCCPSRLHTKTGQMYANESQANGGAALISRGNGFQ